MSNKCKNFAPSLAIGRMQIKTTLGADRSVLALQAQGTEFSALKNVLGSLVIPVLRRETQADLWDSLTRQPSLLDEFQAITRCCLKEDIYSEGYPTAPTCIRTHRNMHRHTHAHKHMLARIYTTRIWCVHIPPPKHTYIENPFFPSHKCLSLSKGINVDEGVNKREPHTILGRSELVQLL